MLRSQLRAFSVSLAAVLLVCGGATRAQTTQVCQPVPACDGTPAAPFSVEKCDVPDAFADVWNVDDGTGSLVPVPAHYVLQPPTSDRCSGPYPLLVLFRGTGLGGAKPDEVCGACPGTCYETNEHWSPSIGSSLMDEASARGWYAMAPLSVPKVPGLGYDRNLGGPQGILNTRLAIAEVLGDPDLDIDRNRIYAVGFSQGGCNALAYAARNLDPEGPYGMFAGLVLLASTASNSYFWHQSAGAAGLIQGVLALDVTTPGVGTCAHPGSPASAALAYQASSGVYTGCDDVSGLSLPPDYDHSIARNLYHIPVRSVIHVGDGTPGLRPQVDLLTDLLTHPLDPHPDFVFTELPSTVSPCGTAGEHCWDLYQYVDIGASPSLLEWFEQGSLCDRMPTSARVLVPEDTVDPLGLREDLRYFYFRVTRHDATRLGDFRWEIASNTLVLRDVDNVKRLRVRTETSCDDCHDANDCSNCFKSGLDPTQALFVEFHGSLSQSLRVLLEGYPSPPSFVARQINGGPWAAVHPAWISNFWNASLQAVRLTESSLGPNDTVLWWVQ